MQLFLYLNYKHGDGAEVKVRANNYFMRGRQPGNVLN
jgi:hypothetical protein